MLFQKKNINIIQRLCTIPRIPVTKRFCFGFFWQTFYYLFMSLAFWWITNVRRYHQMNLIVACFQIIADRHILRQRCFSSEGLDFVSFVSKAYAFPHSHSSSSGLFPAATSVAASRILIDFFHIYCTQHLIQLCICFFKCISQSEAQQKKEQNSHGISVAKGVQNSSDVLWKGTKSMPNVYLRYFMIGLKTIISWLKNRLALDQEDLPGPSDNPTIPWIQLFPLCSFCESQICI